MKNIIIKSFTLLVLVIFWTINPVNAGDRFKVYEMAESGIIIKFIMTPEEIAAKDAENARLAAIKEAQSNSAQERLKVYEIGESGNTISFPMTVEEIAAEDAENTRFAAIRKAKDTEQKKRTVIFTLAESGNSIEFPVKTPAKVVTEAVAEEKYPYDSITCDNESC
jgi:hypothetical protein